MGGVLAAVSMAVNTGGVAGLCRVSVRAPEKSFDLAVPADVQLADLLPTLVEYSGPNLYENGLAHGGWVLQRLGGGPLAGDATPTTLGLHDGDVLYLRPHRDALPEIHFDDLVDGVMGGLRKRADTWNPTASRRLLLGFLLCALATGLVALALPGPTAPRAAACVLTAATLLAGAGSASRAVGDAEVGTALAAGAVPYLVLAGCLVQHDLAGRLLAGGMTGAGGAALALAAVGASAPLFVSAGLVGILAAIAGMPSVQLIEVAAVMAVVVVVLGLLVPGWGFWLSGLRLPPLPANAEQLQEGIDPHPSEAVIARSAVADGYVTGLYVALGLVYAACLTELATGSGWEYRALLLALSLLALLHGRPLGAIWHRLAVVLPGAYGVVLLVIGLAVRLYGEQRLLLLAALVAVSAALAMMARMVPGRRMLPHWGRAADLAHSAAAISVLPLLLLVLGVYHFARGLGG